MPYAVVGGQAVALWVATREPAAVRTTKDVDLLIRRDDLAPGRAAALSVGMDYFEVLGVGMFLDRSDPNPRHAVHLVWAGEKVRPEYELPSPSVDQRRDDFGHPRGFSARSGVDEADVEPRPGPRPSSRHDRRGLGGPRDARRASAVVGGTIGSPAVGIGSVSDPALSVRRANSNP